MDPPQVPASSGTTSSEEAQVTPTDGDQPSKSSSSPVQTKLNNDDHEETNHVPNGTSCSPSPAIDSSADVLQEEEDPLSSMVSSLPPPTTTSESNLQVESTLTAEPLQENNTPATSACSTPHSPSGGVQTPGTPASISSTLTLSSQSNPVNASLPPNFEPQPQQQSMSPHPQANFQRMPYPQQMPHFQHQPPPPPHPGMQMMMAEGHPGMPPGPPIMTGPAGPPTGVKGGVHSGDSQYMQQQSQIFVFSTHMANMAADAVLQQRFPSIIAWHCEREETKQFLEKNPLKTQQFNRQNQPNHTAWLNAMANKNKGPMSRMPGPHSMQGHPMGPQGMGHFGPGMNNRTPGPFGPNGPPNQWQGECGPRGPGNWSGPPGQGFPPNHFGPGGPPNRFPPNFQQHGPPHPSAMHGMPSSPHGNSSPNFPPNCNPHMMQPGMMGPNNGNMNRMEDENLTPQQKQHREEKLATLRQLQQNLQPVLGEQGPQQGQFGGPMMRPDGQFGPPDQMMAGGPPCEPMMHPHQHHPGMNPCPSPGQGEWIKMEPGTGPPVDSPAPPPPVSSGRKRGRQTPSSSNVNSPSANMIANSPRGGHPPPPYAGGHRGSTGSITSPLPASPANNMCPLPSPRMQSPADASRQPPQRPNPYPSPGTPDLMSLNSPKPHMNGPRSGRQSNPSDKKNSLEDVHGACKSPIKSEPQLMPVPSPQQIQYSLNAFEGQELTIQKQPNTSLRDSDLISPPDLDLSFNPDPFHPQQMPPQGPPFPPGCGIENGMRYGPPHGMDGPRFGGPPPMMNNGPQMNEMHPRFMNPDSMQRMPFDGPRGPMPMNGPPHFEGNQSPNMRFCGQPSGPPGSQFMHPGPGHRMRGPPPPGDMSGGRFPAGGQFNQNNMPPFSGPNQMMSGPPRSGDFGMPSPTDPVSSEHLQNLQKMAPPFDIGALPGKNDSPSPMNPMLPGPGMNLGRPNSGPGQFDPISSMASMADSPGPQGMMGPPGSGMSVASSGPNTSVNFHTQMSSMQNMNQGQMNTCPGNGMGFGGPNAAMLGGPQTVNNTYVNANLSIQQLNIQGGPCGPHFDQNMNSGPPGMHPNQMQGNNHMGMNMNDRMSPKMMGRMPGPNNFPGNGPGPRSFPPGPPPSGPTSGPGSRGPRGSGNKPNTIAYHPRNPAQMNQPQQKGPPNLDFLAYNNMDNKMPPQNMQYFGKDGPPPRGPGMNQPGGGRPQLMMRGQNPMQGPGGPRHGPPQMGGPGNFPPDFNRHPQGPNNGGCPPNSMMMGGPPGPPQGNFMYGGPSMSPGPGMGVDSTQPLPPSFNNYGKQGPPPGNFSNPNPNDPNYQVQFQNFQQQLYATNPRGGPPPPQQQQGHMAGGPGPGFY